MHHCGGWSSEALWKKCALENSKTQVLSREIDEVWGVAGGQPERQYVHSIRKRDGKAGKKVANRAFTRECKKTSGWEGLEMGGLSR